MTSRTRKFSLGVKIASILTCVALTAIGFAAWLIITPATPVERSGSFEVYTVEENDIIITVTPTSDTVIQWGKGSTTNTNPWLVVGSDVKPENLTATFSVKVESKNGDAAGLALAQLISSIDVAFEMGDAATYDAAKEAGYVANPVVTVNSTVATYDESTGKASSSVTIASEDTAASKEFTVTVTFDWGTKTSGANPYSYYNGQPRTNDLAAEAKALLEAIAGLQGDTFKLTFSTTGKAAQAS